MREITELPVDCREVLPPGTAGTYQQWQVFVVLEHCDRIKRLQRISLSLPHEQRPRFYEDVVPAERLPIQYNVDIPVLRVVFPDRVFFDTGSDELRPEADAIAGIIAESLRNEPPDVAVFVAGHADRRGKSAMNELLSIERADALATRIFRKGANFSSIWRIGFGEDMPLFAGDDAYAWSQNRRIEFLFAAKPEPVGVWLSDQQLGQLCASRNLADSAKCKASLDPYPDYEAVRVVSAERKRIRPVQRPTRPRKRTTLASDAPTSKAIPSKQDRGAIAPASPPRMIVIPKNAPRIVINPVNRQPDPVKVDL